MADNDLELIVEKPRVTFEMYAYDSYVWNWDGTMMETHYRRPDAPSS